MDTAHLHVVEGQIVLASADTFIDACDPGDHRPVPREALWDITAMAALEKVRDRFQRHDLAVTVKQGLLVADLRQRTTE